MAATIEADYVKYKGAVEIYDILKTKLDNNQLREGQVYSFPVEYYTSIGSTNIFNITQGLLASKGLGITVDSNKWTINASPTDPFSGDYTQLINETNAYNDFVELYDYCYKIFSDKVIRPKLGQRYAFQDVYAAAFDGGLPCNDVITTLSSNFRNSGDNFTSCTNQGAYYENT